MILPEIGRVAIWNRNDPFSFFMGGVQVWASPTGANFNPATSIKCGEEIPLDLTAYGPFVVDCAGRGAAGMQWVVVQQSQPYSTGEVYFSLLEVIVFYA